ncbi:expressed unknown protein [Seminavis robusta]|uniref:Uncharacterized protein n=1 Tax=Seminavis robusta TaxID=568900 RepID=A0A9N8DHZ2_9STRA|nr:expressed unknown protein [Seminavis robusta]|eukprot:Sro155_g070460.1 n/a (639) ;mRNA; r:61819-63987
MRWKMHAVQRLILLYPTENQLYIAADGRLTFHYAVKRENLPSLLAMARQNNSIEVVEILPTEQAFSDPEGFIWVWNHIPNDLVDAVNWDSVRLICSERGSIDGSRGNFGRDFGFCGNENAQLRDTQSLFLPHPNLHMGTMNQAVIKLFVAMSSFVRLARVQHGLNIYNDNLRNQYNAERLHQSNLHEALKVSRRLRRSHVRCAMVEPMEGADEKALDATLTGHFDKYNCPTKEYGMITAWTRTVLDEDTFTTERLGVHGYGKSSCNSFTNKVLMHWETLKGFTDFVPSLDKSLMNVDASNLVSNGGVSYVLPGCHLEKSSPYYASYSFPVRQLMERYKNIKQPLRLLSWFAMGAIVVSHRPVIFYLEINRLTECPCHINGFHIEETDCDTFGLEFLLHMRKKRRQYFEDVSHLQDGVNYPDTLVYATHCYHHPNRHQPSANISPQDSVVLIRSVDTLEQIQYEALALDGGDLEKAFRERNVLYNTIVSILNFKTLQAHDDACESQQNGLHGVYGAGELVCQLLIGFFCHIGTLPWFLLLEAEIGQAQWAYWSNQYNQYTPEGRLTQGRQLLEAMAAQMGTPGMIHRAEEALCQFKAWRQNTYHLRSDVALPEIKHAIGKIQKSFCREVSSPKLPTAKP